MSLVSEGCVQAGPDLHNAVAPLGPAPLSESGQRGTIKLPQSERGRTKFSETARPRSRSQRGGF
jgi:hypothetical protein